MRRNMVIAVIAVAVVAAACTDGPSDTSAPLLSTTTTTPATSTTAEGATTTTAPPATTTVPGTTTTTVPGTTTTTVPLDELELRLTMVAEGLDAPVLLVADPDGGADYVVEQPGKIVRLDAVRTVALDIASDVIYGGEQGLLGLAFHPEFATNRLAYVNYVGEGRRTVIEQFTVGEDGRFDAGSRSVILTVDQPASNHNGGMIAFGPDGYLWIGMGDGGGADDRFGTGQRADTLLGSMLRIAVGVDGVERYAIPPDNPYADGEDGAPEVWAIGLRNPWRFAFDEGVVWIADVGQRQIEEVSAEPASLPGLNYGWPIMEGSSCFASSTCDPSPLVLPVTEYSHADGCSITGGYVYRGPSLPELSGHYFYSDFCSGFLRSHHPEVGDVDWTPSVGTTPSVSGFGIGGDGELHVVSLTGTVHRLERAS